MIFYTPVSPYYLYIYYVKIENFRTEKLRQNNLGQTTFKCFREFQANTTFKEKHESKIYVRTNCDSIINVHLW